MKQGGNKPAVISKEVRGEILYDIPANSADRIRFLSSFEMTFFVKGCFYSARSRYYHRTINNF